MSNEHRTPEGTPAGGQFAVVARIENDLSLCPRSTDPELDAEWTLNRSTDEAIRLTSRLQGTQRDRDATGRALYEHPDDGLARYEARDRSRDWDTDQVTRLRPYVALCEDVADIRALRDGTVLGMAELQHRVESERVQAAAAERSSSWSVQQTAADHQRFSDEAQARLDEVTTDPDLIPVPGAAQMAPALYEHWSHLGMVAAPVWDVDEQHPVAYRVSFVATDAGAEVARITLPARSCTQVGTHQLDAGTIAHEVAALARNPVGIDGATARELVNHLAVRADQVAA